MRGQRVEGRFSIDSERESIISGTNSELVFTVGQYVQWWFYDEKRTDIDPVYDVGAASGGRWFNGPHKIPVIKATLYQGVSIQNERGLYNADVLRITLNMDIAEDNLQVSGSVFPAIQNLATLPDNPDHFLRDRIVFRNEVFTIDQVLQKGIIKGKYTILTIDCIQVMPEELDNDPQFQAFSTYSSFETEVNPYDDAYNNQDRP